MRLWRSRLAAEGEGAGTDEGDFAQTAGVRGRRRGAFRARCRRRLRTGSSKGTASATAIGMSQYGAYGFAQNGRSYEQILTPLLHGRERSGSRRRQEPPRSDRHRPWLDRVHRRQEGLRREPRPERRDVLLSPQVRDGDRCTAPNGSKLAGCGGRAPHRRRIGALRRASATYRGDLRRAERRRLALRDQQGRASRITCKGVIPNESPAELAAGTPFAPRPSPRAPTRWPRRSTATATTSTTTLEARSTAVSHRRRASTNEAARQDDVER